MGQGDPGRQHQGRLIRATPAKYSVTPVRRKCRLIARRDRTLNVEISAKMPLRDFLVSALFSVHEIAPELTGHGLPLGKCEAYNRVYDQFYGSR